MPEKPAPRFHPPACVDCHRSITWARLGKKLIAVETCEEGAGNLALSALLFPAADEMPAAEVVSSGTRYRAHRFHCPRAPAPLGPFSDVGRGRKVRS